jgi:zinc transport system ATP-binding protein
MEHTLEVYRGAALIFHSDGNWLYPLFDLERFLTSTEDDPTDLTVYDKIVGRAAALLMIHLELGRVHAQLISQLGREVLEHYDIPYTYEQQVERISCETEQLLKFEYDPEAAYALLKERAGR